MTINKWAFFDEEGIPRTSSGIYAFTPFDHPDKSGRYVFKVGLTSNLASRIDNYHTSFPSGVYILHFIKYEKNDIDRKDLFDREKDISAYLQSLGAKRIRTTTRARRANEFGGECEWYFSSQAKLKKAFQELYFQEGGTWYSYKMGKRADENPTGKRSNEFTGEVSIPLYFV